MRSVQIAELKNQLSAYLHKVRSGEEIIINDRNVPIAKIVPLGHEDLDLDEQALVAEGLLIPPKKKFDPKKFFAVERGTRMPRVSEAAIRKAIKAVREDVNVGVLGYKRTRQSVRPRPNQPTR